MTRIWNYCCIEILDSTCLFCKPLASLSSISRISLNKLAENIETIKTVNELNRAQLGAQNKLDALEMQVITEKEELTCLKGKFLTKS